MILNQSVNTLRTRALRNARPRVLGLNVYDHYMLSIELPTRSLTAIEQPVCTDRDYMMSSLSLNHHLYADDTQLFFLPSDFDDNITLLHNVLQHISSSMTANLLTYSQIS